MNDLNDPLDDIFASGPKAERAPVSPAAAAYVAKASSPEKAGVWEPCVKCRGTGRFISWSGRSGGACFACKGEKGRTISHKAIGDRARKVAKAEDKVAEFEAANPHIAAWWTGSTFAFAISLREAVAKYGYLTENQLAAAERCVAKLQAMKASDKARVDEAPAVNSDALHQAFERAVNSQKRKIKGDHVEGVKRKAPRLTFSAFVIKQAPAFGRNAGALYVTSTTERDAEGKRLYLGKVQGGKFFATRDCPANIVEEINKVAADPKKAAVEYGQRFKMCCICNAELTNAESIERGMGPVCAENYGW